MLPLRCSHVHCQGTEQEKRDSLKKSEMYLFPEIFVYNKKKIQMIFVEYGFNFTREVKYIYIYIYFIRGFATHEI